MKTILIVENYDRHRLLYKQEFQYEGYNVITVKDGLEALKITNNHPPDLIVMDIFMQSENSLKAMGKILGKHRSIPIIINTSFRGSQNNLISRAADACILKSADLWELKSKIKELTGK